MLKGKSRARAQGRFLQAPQNQESSTVAPDKPVEEETSKRTKRHATVYDAVAGRIGLNGFLPTHTNTTGTSTPANNLPPPPPPPRPSSSTKTKPLTPQEVLLRRVRAPTHVPVGYYSADEALAPDQPLPESDLLKAIHAYASDFYSMATSDKGRCDFRSMDETALLALGVLLEEAAVEVLGETGDMVLVEPEGLENVVPEDRMTRHQVRGRVRPVATPELEAESEVEVEVEERDVNQEEEGGGAGERRRKRRRYNVF